MKVLILKPSSLGDVVQALPVLRLLKLQHPASEVYWWIDSGLTSLLENDPDLAGIIPFHRQRWRRPWRWPELARSVFDLRAHRFDWIIDLQSLFRSGIMAWLADGRLTIGLDDAREGAHGFYDLAVPRPSYHTHAVDWYLEVARRLGVPTDRPFSWLPENPGVARAIRGEWPDDHARWIALQPGARWLNKRWPAESFAAVMRTLLKRGHDNLRFAVLGGTADRPLGQQLAAAAPGKTVDLTGTTTLPQMVEWVRRCEVLVTNDTGPMHVAAALGKPVVALFGPTAPQRTGPYGQADHVLQANHLPCVPCLKDVCRHEQPLACLHALTPGLVVERMEQLLAPARPSSTRRVLLG